MKPLFKTLCLFSLLAFTFGGFLQLAQAADLIVPIGGLKTLEQAADIPTYIKTIYTWGIGAGALLAVLMLVVGGLQYVLAAGNLGTTESAKQRMSSAVLGVVLLLSISLILRFINPELTLLDLKTLPGLKKADSSIFDAKGAFLPNADGSIPRLDFSNKESLGKIKEDLGELQSYFKQIDAQTQDPAEKKARAEQYGKALDSVRDQFNAYFDSPEYREIVRKSGSAGARLGGGPLTEKQITEKIKQDKDAAWSEITDNMGANSFKYDGTRYSTPPPPANNSNRQPEPTMGPSAEM